MLASEATLVMTNYVLLEIHVLLHVRAAFCFDKHFSEQGFEVIA